MLGLDLKAARYTWTAVCVVALVGLLYLIRSTLFIFFLAVLLSYLLWPLVSFVDSRLPGHSRAAALALVYLAMVGVVIVFSFTIGSIVVQQATAFADRLPDLISRVQAPSTPFDEGTLKGIFISRVKQELVDRYPDIMDLIPKAAFHVLSRARILFFVILVPILSFFLLKDAGGIRTAALSVLPEGSWRDMIENIAADLHALLGQYIRALVLLGAVTFVVYGLVLWVVGVPYSILLAAIAAPLEIIPVLGPLIGASTVLLVEGLGGAHHLLGIFLFLIVFRLFQDYAVSPHFMSAGIKLHPLLIIFGVLAGGSTAGIPGSFLSVPVLATLRIVYRQLVSHSFRQVVAPEGPSVP